MIALYRLFISLVYGLIYPYGRVRAAANELWRGRLGLISPSSPVDIWLHAASVGEIKVIGFLIAYLKEHRPELRLHVTTMTRQGFRAASAAFAGTAEVSFFPLDAGHVIRRTLDQLKPGMVVVAETEIWPNLLLCAARRGIPTVLVNGRMSAGACGKYRLAPGMMRRLLSCYDWAFIKSESDRERFAGLGLPSERTTVTGDMKFDAPLVRISEGRVREIRARMAVKPDEFLLVAGSTRSGEEKLLVAAYRRLRSVYGHVRLLLAPRHTERSGEIGAWLESTGLPWYIFGDRPVSDGIVLVDRMGILNDLYLAADLAFVGGTLVDIGGHNILEPVWVRTPVVFGPYISNVTEAADYILSHDYGVRLDSVDDLAATLEEIVSGKRCFAEKTESDLESSATTVAGNYILKRLADAGKNLEKDPST